MINLEVIIESESVHENGIDRCRFCLNGSMINRWLLHRHVDSKMSLLELTRQVVIALLASSNVEKKKGIAPKTKKQILDATRLDGKGHLVDTIKTRVDVLPAVHVPSSFV